MPDLQRPGKLDSALCPIQIRLDPQAVIMEVGLAAAKPPEPLRKDPSPCLHTQEFWAEEAVDEDFKSEEEQEEEDVPDSDFDEPVSAALGGSGGIGARCSGFGGDQG